MTTPEFINAFYSGKEGSQASASVQQLPFSVLPEHEVTIRVQYSSLNYKDALSARGLSGVTRNYPHIPGIDAAGVVVKDNTGTYAPGDEVLVTGYDLGTNTFGGFSDHLRVPVEWIVPLPEALSLQQTMIIGTAGFTALYGLIRLQREGIHPESGPILITGATGGVGSFGVFALSQLGYEVIAASRKDDQAEFLTSLGASEVILSDELLSQPNRPLLKGTIAGAIETVGGSLLDAVLRQTSPKGAVTCCGNVLGIDLNTNVLPFILRGISLLGIDSASCVRSIREDVWNIASSLDFDKLPEDYFRLVPLANANEEIDRILEGGQTGRVVFQIS